MMHVPGAFAASMGRLLEGLGVDPFAGLGGLPPPTAQRAASRITAACFDTGPACRLPIRAARGGAGLNRRCVRSGSVLISLVNWSYSLVTDGVKATPEINPLPVDKSVLIVTIQFRCIGKVRGFRLFSYGYLILSMQPKIKHYPDDNKPPS